MTEEHHAITLDYEKTVAELRGAVERLNIDIEIIVDECDNLRAAYNRVYFELQQRTENGKLLLQTIDLLRSENERLKIALQTGEQ